MFELRVDRDGYSIDAAMEKGRPVPEWFKEEPPLHPADLLYIEAFYELSSCRPMGFAPGPIPWKDMVAYAEYAGLERDMWRDFVAVLRAMDNAYLRWLARQKPANDEGGVSKDRPPVPQGPRGRRRGRWLNSSA